MIAPILNACFTWYVADTDELVAAAMPDTPADTGPLHPPRSRRWRRWRRVLLTLEVLACLFVPFEYVVFINPPSDARAPADVVVALGGNAQPNRIKLAIELAHESPGTHVLISSYNRKGKLYCPWTKKYPDVDITCFYPQPATTQGEARYTATYAHNVGATSVDVVDTADQLLRARLRFSRCWDGELRMIEAPASNKGVVHLIPYQTAAMVKALVLQPTC